MKVKFIKNAAAIGFGYFAGDEADLKEAVAKELFKDGYAVNPSARAKSKPDKSHK